MSKIMITFIYKLLGYLGENQTCGCQETADLSHLLKKFLMENFIFCAVVVLISSSQKIPVQQMVKMQINNHYQMQRKV